jgi:hypothetical protein
MMPARLHATLAGALLNEVAIINMRSSQWPFWQAASRRKLLQKPDHVAFWRNRQNKSNMVRFNTLEHALSEKPLPLFRGML